MLAQGVKVRTSFCSQAQMNGFKFMQLKLVFKFSFLFLPHAGATIVPSVEWWQGQMSSLIPALEHTNTWRSSMNVFHTVSTSFSV